MQSSRIIPFAALLAVVSVCSTLEAQLLSRPALRGRIVGRPAASAAAASNYAASGWYPYVVARPADRYWIRETPIEQRPNRPLHFWGNSRRRIQPVQPGIVMQEGTVISNVVPEPETSFPLASPVPATTGAPLQANESIYVDGVNR